MYVCMYACVCMYVCMCVCLFVCVSSISSLGNKRHGPVPLASDARDKVPLVIPAAFS